MFSKIKPKYIIKNCIDQIVLAAEYIYNTQFI